MSTLITNQELDTLFIKATERFTTINNDGLPVTIEAGQQFKWAFKSVPSSCTACGSRGYYYITSYSYCPPDTLFPGKGYLIVPSDYFLETYEQMTYPITKLWELERYKGTSWEKPPHLRPASQNYYWRGPVSEASYDPDCWPCAYQPLT